MRYPGMRELRAVALLISYDGRLPNVKLRHLMSRMGISGRIYRGDGPSEGSAPGFYARRVAAYLRSEGLVTVEGTGTGATIVAAVSLTELANWLADALDDRERALARRAERDQDEGLSDAAV